MVHRRGNYVLSEMFVRQFRYLTPRPHFFYSLMLYQKAMEKEMEAAMTGMQWPPGVDEMPPSGDGENPECKQS